MFGFKKKKEPGEIIKDKDIRIYFTSRGSLKVDYDDLIRSEGWRKRISEAPDLEETADDKSFNPLPNPIAYNSKDN